MHKDVVFFCSYYCTAVFANQELFLLILHVIIPVVGGHIINLVREFHAFSCNTVFLTLPTKNAFSIIAPYYSYSFFAVIFKCNCQRRANIGAGLAAHAILIINYGLTTVIFVRLVRLFRIACSISGSNQGNNRLFYFTYFRILHFSSSL